MRIHITVDDQLVHELDERVGPGNRSAFIVQSLRQALDDRRRWEAIVESLGQVGDDHEWDDDPAGWVRAQRRADGRRVG